MCWVEIPANRLVEYGEYLDRLNGRRSASTAKPEPAFTVGPKPLYEQQPMPQIGELVEASSTPTNFGYEVSTSGGPRESRTVVYHC